jgi:ABC-type uncharacterized transport system involved in gliding motility auxiliary subunit
VRNPFAAARPRALARFGILLALVLFLAFNVFAARGVTQVSLDLTADRRFTLAPATVEVVRSLEEPIRLRLFLSRLLTDLNPGYAAHAQRVTALLQRLSRLSRGMLALEVYDPQPFSPEEDLAVASGVQGLPLDVDTGELVYFGLAGRNSTDDQESIAFFSLERASFLEYDLARLISELARPEKPKIALLGRAALAGDQSTGYQPQVIFSLLQEFYEVTVAEAGDGTIDDDVEVLLLAQPEGLSPAELYAVDQYVLSGRPLLAFVDPFSEREAAVAAQQLRPPGMADLSGIAPAFAAWGFEVPEALVAGDRQSARRVIAQSQGRQVVTDYVVWLTLNRNRFAADEPMLAELSLLNLNSAGTVDALPDATTTLEPLVTTSPLGMRIPVELIASAPDPVALLAAYNPEGPLPLAARIAGEVPSRYGESPPEELRADAAVDFAALELRHLPQSAAPIHVVVIADSDFLYDQTWLAADQNGGGQVMPVANNADLVLNALEALAGRGGLASLRGRGLIDRPFEVIEAMNREAELRFRQREAELVQRIQEAETKIGQIEDTAEGGLVLSPEQEAAIEELRVELLEARRELREVQHGLRDDLERLVGHLQLLNIAAVPALVALIGLGVAVVRRRRALAPVARG